MLSEEFQKNLNRCDLLNHLVHEEIREVNISGRNPFQLKAAPAK
jgi:hypothetical protein